LAVFDFVRSCQLTASPCNVPKRIPTVKGNWGMVRRPNISEKVADVRSAPPERSLDGAGGRAQEAEAPSYEGQVAGIQNGFIVGWAWDPGRPYAPVEVELYVQDVLVGRGKADIFDLELAKGNRGNGMHRFELRIDRLPSFSPPFEIRAVIAGTERELLPPVVVSSLDEAEALLSGSEYIGRVTGIENGMLCGWVQNRRNPHELPVLVLRIAGSPELTAHAGERVNVVMDTGFTTSAFRFRLPLPPFLLDGGLHVLSVSAGSSDRQLENSPILFGASDVGSICRTLAQNAQRLDVVEKRLSAIPDISDVTTLENGIVSKLLLRVDGLLNIHRDSLERELAVIRHQLSQVIRHIPDMDPDVIAPIGNSALLHAVQLLPESAFTPIGRSAPLITYQFSTQTTAARPKNGLSWSKLGISISGSGSIDLEQTVEAPASIAVRGLGARDPSEFHGVVMTFNGRPMSGRFDIGPGGEWAFTGTQIPGATEGEQGFAIAYLTDVSRPSGGVVLTELSIFSAGKAPAQILSNIPATSVLNLGIENTGRGWYPPEAGQRGGFCWMAEDGEIAINVVRDRTYRLCIPEIRPLTAAVMKHMRVFLEDSPVSIDVSTLHGDESTYRAVGQCELPTRAAGPLRLRVSFPRELVKSPFQLGLNDDLRPLSIAVRAVSVSAMEA
jgi:hypothetical protein